MNLCAGARQLRRHGPFLIAGGGEVGRKVVELLSDAGEETFLIHTQPGPSVNLVGNVLDTQLLKQAGVENVQAVILALNTDSTTLSLRSFSKTWRPMFRSSPGSIALKTSNESTPRAPTLRFRSVKFQGNCLPGGCSAKNPSPSIPAPCDQSIDPRLGKISPQPRGYSRQNRLYRCRRRARRRVAR